MNADNLMTKDQLAQRLGMKRRGVECLVKNGRIPVIRISKRCVRFSWPKVEKALGKLETGAVS
jgi:excisionase family DNA binding protein